VRVDQLKFNKSCTSFIGDLKKERKNSKTFAKYSTSYTKTKFVIEKKKKKKIIIYELDVKLLILFNVNRNNVTNHLHYTASDFTKIHW